MEAVYRLLRAACSAFKGRRRASGGDQLLEDAFGLGVSVALSHIAQEWIHAHANKTTRVPTMSLVGNILQQQLSSYLGISPLSRFKPENLLQLLARYENHFKWIVQLPSYQSFQITMASAIGLEPANYETCPNADCKFSNISGAAVRSVFRGARWTRGNVMNFNQGRVRLGRVTFRSSRHLSSSHPIVTPLFTALFSAVPFPETHPITANSFSTMAEEEFDHPERKALLESLVSAVPNITGSTTWAALWLADIDKLRAIVQKARDSPYSFWRSVRTVEDAKLIPKCEFTNLIFL